VSLDANYILVYEILPYIPPTPMQKDINYLKEKYGGVFETISEGSIYWEKPKYTLPLEEISNLMADQILERKDCELWKVIKGYT
jgi:hypothetical protein